MRKVAVAAVLAVLVLVAPFAALAQGLPTAAPEQVGLSTARLARIGETLREKINERDLRMADVPEGCELVKNDAMPWPTVCVDGVYVGP